MRRLGRKADVQASVRLLTSIYLSDNEFALLSSLPGNVLRKTRHYLGTVNGSELSVDEFAGPLAGLIMAEAEFEDMESLSSYLSPDFAFQEVTEDISYTGGELALNGRPKGR